MPDVVFTISGKKVRASFDHTPNESEINEAATAIESDMNKAAKPAAPTPTMTGAPPASSFNTVQPVGMNLAGQPSTAPGKVATPASKSFGKIPNPPPVAKRTLRNPALDNPPASALSGVSAGLRAGMVPKYDEPARDPGFYSDPHSLMNVPITGPWQKRAEDLLLHASTLPGFDKLSDAGKAKVRKNIEAIAKISAEGATDANPGPEPTTLAAENTRLMQRQRIAQFKAEQSKLPTTKGLKPGESGFGQIAEQMGLIGQRSDRQVADLLNTHLKNKLSPEERLGVQDPRGPLFNIAPELYSGLAKIKGGPEGFAAGLAEAASGMATTENAQIGILLGPMAGLGKEGKAAQVAVSGVFGAQGAKQAKEGIEEYIKTGDTKALGRAAFGAGVAGIALGHAGSSAVEGTPLEGAPGIGKAIKDLPAADLSKEPGLRQLIKPGLSKPERAGLTPTGKTPSVDPAFVPSKATPNPQIGRMTPQRVTGASKPSQAASAPPKTKTAQGKASVTVSPIAPEAVDAQGNIVPTKGETNAVPQQGAGGVLQRQPQETGNAGGKRGGVEPGKQGQAIAAADKAVTREVPTTTTRRTQEKGTSEAATPQEAVKPAHEMNEQELEQAYQQAKQREHSVEVEVLGEAGAKRWRWLHKAFGSSDNAKADAAQSEIDAIESKINPSQRSRLYGIGEKGDTSEDVRDYQRALGRLDYERPEALGNSLKYAVTQVGTEVDPAKMTHSERLAYAQIRHATEIARLRGWDLETVRKEALKGARQRFDQTPDKTGESDADFMLKRFMQEKATVEGAMPKSTLQEKMQATVKAAKAKADASAATAPFVPTDRVGDQLVRVERIPGEQPGQEKVIYRDASGSIVNTKSKVISKLPMPPKATGLGEAPKGSHRGAINLGPPALGSPAARTGEAIKTAAGKVGEAAKEVRQWFDPAGVSAEAGTTGRIIRERNAERARQNVQVSENLHKLKLAFDRVSEHDQLDFIDRMERGRPQVTPEMTEAAKTLRQTLDYHRELVQSLGNGKLENFNADYFPHIWKDPAKAADALANFGTGRRPLEGSKAFLKARTIPLTKDGISKGLVPVTTNPVQLAILKMHEMQKYVMGQRVFNDMKDAGLVHLERGQIPDGYAAINDKIAKVVQRRETIKASGNPGAPEYIERGQWVAPEDAARVLNNYLSPGLGGSQIFRGARAINNVLNQAQLGLSAYHFTFTSVDTAVSQMALGIKQVVEGKPLKGLGNIATVPIAPIKAYLRGDKLAKEYTSMAITPSGETLSADLQNLMAGGGRFKMDQAYRTGAWNAYKEALNKAQGSREQGKTVEMHGELDRADMLSLPAAVEAASAPLMEHVVPRLKLGVFAQLAESELSNLANQKAKTGEAITPDEYRKVMARAWDSVDNRLGQLVYDNLFWNRALVDIGQIGTRSLGWNLGSIREVGGGLLDYGGIGKKVITRKGPIEMTPRMSYVIALPATIAMIGAVMQYMMIGERPKDLKDYFFPRTGKMRPDGKPERVQIASYMKDVKRFSEDPVGTLSGKTGPLFNAINEMIHNEDWYGDKIKNADDPIIKQAADEFKYMAKQFAPISLHESRPGVEETPKEKVGKFFGITKAPANVDRSRLENREMKFKAAAAKAGKLRKELPPGALPRKAPSGLSHSRGARP